jgi:hypothetical protein
VPIAEGPKSEARGLPPAEALSRALHDTLRLLFRPFRGRRWIKLTVVCLFLGGGTPTAAFHWSLSSLPGDIPFSEVFLRAVDYITRSPWLTILAIVLALGIVLAWLYLRSVFRFVLVDSIFRTDVLLGPSWTGLRPLGQSYFFWLVGMLAVLGITFSVVVVAVYPYFQASASRGTPSLVPSLLLVALLVSIVLAGLAVALLVVLTDDLVVPLMYAQKTSLARAWREVARAMRAEPAPFAVYLLLRLALAIGIGVAVLFVLFLVLLSFFSAAIIVAALVVLILRVLGLGWVWNPSTILLAVAALFLLSSLLLILLSVVGMPGQVFFQEFGIHFIASRFPPLEALWGMRQGASMNDGQAGQKP